MNFVSEFIEEVQVKRANLTSLFGDRVPNQIETLLSQHLQSRWHALPQGAPASGHEYSVDSSSASRSLVNGADLFIIRALMLGSDGSRNKKMAFESMRGIADADLAARFERVMRDLIEIQITVENMPEQDGDIVLIDGNLYGRYTCIIRQIDIDGWEHLPLLLWDAMQRMFEASQENGVTVVGASKFSKTRTLSHALLQELGHPFEALDIPDVEMIYRWKQGESGFTTPLILGDYGFREGLNAISKAPESYLRRSFRGLPESLRRWGLEVVERVPKAPAFAMFHLVPEVGEYPLRVDVPVDCLGVTKQIRDVSPFYFADPSLVEEVVKQLVADRGGRDVYNALLYVVDREVRLSSKVVDDVYRQILRRELDMSIEYDRSSRRFFR